MIFTSYNESRVLAQIRIGGKRRLLAVTFFPLLYLKSLSDICSSNTAVLLPKLEPDVRTVNFRMCSFHF